MSEDLLFVLKPNFSDPAAGFRFTPVPPKIAGLGTFPVRAYAIVES